jgi:hypothetical protein
MIHKLDIHGLNEGTLIAENMAHSPNAEEIEKLSESIKNHVCAAANGLQLKKCAFAFRVCSACLKYLHNFHGAAVNVVTGLSTVEPSAAASCKSSQQLSQQGSR